MRSATRTGSATKRTSAGDEEELGHALLVLALHSPPPPRCSEETLEHYVCGGGEDGSFPPAADGLSDADTADALCAGYCQIKGKQTGAGDTYSVINHICSSTCTGTTFHQRHDMRNVLRTFSCFLVVVVVHIQAR